MNSLLVGDLHYLSSGVGGGGLLGGRMVFRENGGGSVVANIV